MIRRALTLTLLMGCPKPQPVGPMWAEVPRLPAPTAGSYNRSAESPTDRPVAQLVGRHRWDASLSGAAAGLALDLVKLDTKKALTRWKVREAAWKAGYAYPILDARAWNASEDGAPPPQLLEWLATVPTDHDLGLVRARGQEGDVWVGLRAHPAADIGRVPRQVAEGTLFRLPALPGATYAIADANGALQSGALDTPLELTCGTRGEWLVSVEKDGTQVASFPFYVGIVPPELPLIPDVQPVRDAVDVIARTEELLDNIRQSYGAEGLERDFMLDAGARSLLSGGSTTRDGVLGSLGLAEEQTALWQCDSATVEACMDRILWMPDNRAALLHDDSDLGLAAEVTPGGVRLVGILSRTD